MLASWLKGLIVGACTVVAAAIVIAAYAVVRDGTSNPLPLLFIIALAGMLPGMAVGVVAGLIADRLPVARRLVMIALAAAGVAALGVLSIPEMIPAGMIPAIAGALALEWWTRDNLSAPRPPRIPLSPVLVGMLLGLANAFVSAFVLAFVDLISRYADGHDSHGHAFELAFALFVIGAMAAVPLGALIGVIAGALGAASLTVRRLVLGALAGSCILLGPLASFPLDLVLPALPSTLIAALVLERLTRRAPPLPPARALV